MRVIKISNIPPSPTSILKQQLWCICEGVTVYSLQNISAINSQTSLLYPVQDTYFSKK